MDAQQIKAFIDAMAASDLQEMEVQHAGWTLRLARAGAAGSVRAPQARAPAARADALATAADATEASYAIGGPGANAPSHAAGAPHSHGAPHANGAPHAKGAPYAKGAPQPATAAGDDVLSPLFGVVHLQKAPGEPPYVQVGDSVAAGQVLCTIEAMKVFNEVCAERPGRVAAVLVASGAEVEAGHPLLRIVRDDAAAGTAQDAGHV